MLAAIKNYLAGVPYLRDVDAMEIPGYVILISPMMRGLHIPIGERHGNYTITGGGTFTTADYVTWSDNWFHTQLSTDVVMGRLFDAINIPVSEESARAVAEMVSITPHWIGDSQWDRGQRLAVYIANGNMIIAKFRPYIIQIGHRSWKYYQYKEFLRDIRPAPTIDMLIEKLIAERDQLRKEYPELEKYGYQLNDSAYYAFDGRAVDCNVEVHKLAGLLRIMNDVLPQPIAEEIVPEI